MISITYVLNVYQKYPVTYSASLQYRCIRSYGMTPYRRGTGNTKCGINIDIIISIPIHNYTKLQACQS